MFERNEFAINNHNFDFEITCSINNLHMLGHQDKLFELAIGNMLCSSELDMVTNGSKERILLIKNKSPKRVTYWLADRIEAGTAT